MAAVEMPCKVMIFRLPVATPCGSLEINRSKNNPDRLEVIRVDGEDIGCFPPADSIWSSILNELDDDDGARSGKLPHEFAWRVV